MDDEKLLEYIMEELEKFKEELIGQITEVIERMGKIEEKMLTKEDFYKGMKEFENKILAMEYFEERIEELENNVLEEEDTGEIENDIKEAIREIDGHIKRLDGINDSADRLMRRMEEIDAMLVSMITGHRPNPYASMLLRPGSQANIDITGFGIE